MSIEDPRLRRERQTLQAMFQLYCSEQQHLVSQEQPGSALCVECQRLEDYALERLERCPFQADKPTCANCTVHCYKPEVRARVQTVMRVSGPRMLLRHPVLTARHLLDGRRKPPALKRRSVKRETKTLV
jgi:hypothetical protein